MIMLSVFSLFSLIFLGMSPFSEASCPDTSQNLIKPEISLPCSQNPATGLHPQLDEVSPRTTSDPISLISILILFSHLHLRLPSGSLLQASPPKL
jgi:hypothetical protein